MIKTGLYFGSFNPIHIGHMAIANYMVEFTEIDQLWFVVSPQNPLKKKKPELTSWMASQSTKSVIPPSRNGLVLSIADEKLSTKSE